MGNISDSSQGRKWNPIYTNESGLVELKDLMFSLRGPASNSVEGIYLIEFVCDGVSSGKFPIKVLSSIRFVNWITEPPRKVFAKAESTYDFMVTLQILNSGRYGVGGKIPRKVQIAPSKNVRFRQRNDLSIFHPSTKDGLITVYIKISELSHKLNNLYCYLLLALVL